MFTDSRYDTHNESSRRALTVIKDYETDAERPLARSKLAKLQIGHNRYKLISIPQARAISQPTPTYSKKYKLRHKYTDDRRSNQIDNKIFQARKQIQLNQKINNIYSPQRPHRLVNILSNDNYSFNRRSFFNEDREMWQNSHPFQSRLRKNKMIQRLKPINKFNQQYLRDSYQEQDDEEPVIDKMSIKREGRHLMTYQPIWRQSRSKSYNHRQKRSFKYLIKKFKRVANAVLFTIYLRTFNQKMRRNRLGYFQRFIRQDINQKLLDLKKYFIQCSKPFFSTIIDQHNFDYRPQTGDDIRLNRQKISSLKKLVELEIKCLEKCIRTMANKDYLSQILYYLCKHGNYAAQYELNTMQELSITCISQFFGYMRGDKNQQKSAIINLVFVKILLFNIFFQPETLDAFMINSYDKKIIYSNLGLVGNIIYELLIDIQDNLLQKAPSIYIIGNWVSLRNRFNLRVVDSMTVKPSYFQKNELISGLLTHRYVKQVYGTKFMVDSRNMLEQFLRLLHQNIVCYHQKIRKRYFY